MNINAVNLQDKQKVYDRACKFLLDEIFKKSINGHGYCAYRGLDGLKCVIGDQIDDSEYDPKMENNTVRCLVNMGFVSGDSCFLDKIQIIHDSGPFSYKEIFNELKVIANQYNLKTDKLEKLNK